ncbi:electron transport complex subunit RsxD [Psychrosphaera aestuarii]|uniref:electron transport complex subunit RsxD n=1 Tax=Psychrosphaera aestuarii TaxID=1266052 RepID=UPI001B330D2B|nr:electron transport complex subunit RsxD [Psychrosphaera aestuarii]
MTIFSSMFKSSPHGAMGMTTNQVMRMVSYATIPGFIAQLYFYGWGSLVQLVLCIVVAVLSEAIVLSLREKRIRRTLSDGSAVLTGVLLALSIPPLAPWWISVIGVAFAIIIVKQLYGGLGFNLFNPAMAGYVVLLISFPVAMTSWQPIQPLLLHSLSLADTAWVIFTGFSFEGYNLQQLSMLADGTTMATPLDQFKTSLAQQQTVSEVLALPIYGEYGGVGSQWVNAAYLLGGLLLLKQGIIRWHIPLSILITLFLLSFISSAVGADSTYPPVQQLFTGATMLGAFFIATDPVSASTTAKGRLVFGAIIGALIFIIRQWGGYPDGVAFAVLLANMCVPLIDHYTQPTVYGHKR